MANFGLPVRGFSFIGTFFAAGGGFASFKRIAIPIKCLHIYFLRKFEHVHVPSRQVSLSGTKLTIHTENALFLNCSNVFQRISLTVLI